jgi:hypothetical protein
LFLTGCQVGDEFFTFPFLGQHDVVADGGRRPNQPPELTAVFVAPLQTGVGSTIALSARARDPDGDLVTYYWTGTGGEIDQPRAADATYTCKTKGTHAVAIVVRDPGGLTAVSVIDVACV